MAGPVVQTANADNKDSNILEVLIFKKDSMFTVRPVGTWAELFTDTNADESYANYASIFVILILPLFHRW
jgi:hypothetical protein